MKSFATMAFRKYMAQRSLAKLDLEVAERSLEEIGAVAKHNFTGTSTEIQTLESLGLTIPADTLLSGGTHRGGLKIRSMVAQTANRGMPGVITAEDVLVTAGATMALFIVNITLLSTEDHVIVLLPCYRLNVHILQQSVKCEISYVCLKLIPDEGNERHFVNVADIYNAIRPNTKLISMCSPVHPTGIMFTASEIRRLSNIAKESECYLLIDETLVDMKYQDGWFDTCRGAELGEEHIITVSSISKTYGVPGVRIGWLTTKDPRLMEEFLDCKRQISAVVSAVDELIAEHILARRTALVQDAMAKMHPLRDLIETWVMQGEDFDWVRPEAGTQCLIRIRKTPEGGLEEFYKRLLVKHGVFVLRGTHYCMNDAWFVLQFGRTTLEKLELGLSAISAALASCPVDRHILGP